MLLGILEIAGAGETLDMQLVSLHAAMSGGIFTARFHLYQDGFDADRESEFIFDGIH